MGIIGDVVIEWQKHASDRKTIVFGSTIRHCEEITRQFNESGIMAACFTSETTADERAGLLKETPSQIAPCVFWYPSRRWQRALTSRMLAACATAGR